MVTKYTGELDFAQGLDFSQILTNPILDIAARFWETDRYKAFRVCYRSMRLIDDLVDNRRILGTEISAEEADQLRKTMFDWLESTKQRTEADQSQQELYEVLERFRVPLWPWEKLCQSMAYDLEHNGFASFHQFLRYTEGAAIAPASVFMHLCGVRRDANKYVPPGYDIRKAARPLALFSYLVHILRDFQKDQQSGLNYFADDLLLKHSLQVSDLRQIADGKPATSSFRALMGNYKSFAEYYREKARRTINELSSCLEPRYGLSLEIIYGLYLQIFERVDPESGVFTEKELNPTPAQVQVRIEDIVAEFTRHQQT
ncbi:MAG: hypothetical protein DRP45_02205 [Candidatus Zixiibacteriota bacterium]|nr:MAG: hypothetical protein DRP45_02205 [candidate division Zixibacteria bacterium]